MGSGLILFFYITAHLVNHALGLVSLQTAEAGMSIAVEVWYSLPGTVLLYGAVAVHFVMALVAVYERRTFRLPPLELIRIALGFSMPVLLIGHVARDAACLRPLRALVGLHARGRQSLGVGTARLAIGADGAGLASRLPRAALCVQPAAAVPAVPAGPVCHRAAAAGPLGARIYRDGTRGCGEPHRGRGVAELSEPRPTPRSAWRSAQWKDSLLNWYFTIILAAFVAREIRNLIERRRKGLDQGELSRPDRQHSARLVGAGGEPQLSPAACGDVRRAGAMLDLPGPGGGRGRALSAAGEGRAGHADPHRRTGRRASGVSVAAAGQRLGRARGPHRAPGLSCGSAAPRRRERYRRALLRFPEPRGADVRSPAAGSPLCPDGLCRRAEPRHPRGRRDSQFDRQSKASAPCSASMQAPKCARSAPCRPPAPSKA